MRSMVCLNLIQCLSNNQCYTLNKTQQRVNIFRAKPNFDSWTMQPWEDHMTIRRVIINNNLIESVERYNKPEKE